VREHSVRHRCLTAVRELDIPEPFDLTEFVTRLEHHRSRKIHLVAIPPMPDGLCGMCVPMGTTDYIFHEEGSSPLHREHIIMHELGHAIMEHEGGGLPVDAVAPLLFPTLDPELVRHVLGRTAYSTREEKEAETLATMILRRAHRPLHHDLQIAPEHADVLRRLEATWGRPRRRT
jgi:hypothetical protein